MEPAEDGAVHDCRRARRLAATESRAWTRHSLPEPLMRAASVEMADVGAEGTKQVPFAEDEQVIETVAPYAAEKALTYGIREWRAYGGS